MKKRKTGRSSSAVAGIVALLALGGGALYLGLSRRSASPPIVSPAGASSVTGANAADSGSILPMPQIQPQSSPGAAGGTAEAGPPPIAVYTVAETADGEHLERRLLPPGSVHGDSNDARTTAALNAMAEEPNSPLPSGTRVRSVKLGADGVATVDFNRAFQDNFSGGDEAEALTLNAVLATVGQFPGVRSVQFLVEGTKIDSLGGTQSLTAPLPIPQDLLTGARKPAAVAKSEP